MYYNSLCIVTDYHSVYLCRIVKLTSPNLNYFIIAGAIIMYASTFFYVLPTTSVVLIQACCIVSVKTDMHEWLLRIMYHMQVGTMALHYWIYNCFWNTSCKNVASVPNISQPNTR